MEPFEYSIKNNQFKRYKTQRWLFVILGGVYTAQSIIFYIEENSISYAYFLGGVFMLIIGLLDKKFVDGFKITFDSIGIRFNSPAAPILKSGNLYLTWSEIKSYHLAPLKIELKLQNESTKAIPLDALGYNDVRLIKNNFEKFAKHFKIKEN